MLQKWDASRHMLLGDKKLSVAIHSPGDEAASRHIISVMKPGLDNVLVKNSSAILMKKFMRSLRNTKTTH
jgi:hypothetical protein